VHLRMGATGADFFYRHDDALDPSRSRPGGVTHVLAELIPNRTYVRGYRARYRSVRDVTPGAASLGAMAPRDGSTA